MHALKQTKFNRVQHSNVVSIFASEPSCLWINSSFPKNISVEKNAGVAEVNQQLCLKESGQWLESVDQTHLVLASGKLVVVVSLSVSGLSFFIYSIFSFRNNLISLTSLASNIYLKKNFC